MSKYKFGCVIEILSNCVCVSVCVVLCVFVYVRVFSTCLSVWVCL